MNWKEANVNLPADAGGHQYTLVFASDMVTQDLRCVFLLLSSLPSYSHFVSPVMWP